MRRKERVVPCMTSLRSQAWGPSSAPPPVSPAAEEGREASCVLLWD